MTQWAVATLVWDYTYGYALPLDGALPPPCLLAKPESPQAYYSSVYITGSLFGLYGLRLSDRRSEESDLISRVLDFWCVERATTRVYSAQKSMSQVHGHLPSIR